MKILIDDFRLLINGELPDIVVRNYNAAEELIFALGGDSSGSWPEHDLFIDHDLGEDDDSKTGYSLMCIFEEIILNDSGKAKDYTPKSITCVSDNGPGRQRIQQVIDKIYGV